MAGKQKGEQVPIVIQSPGLPPWVSELRVFVMHRDAAGLGIDVVNGIVKDIVDPIGGVVSPAAIGDEPPERA
ncbi:MAG: hypothetical protein ACREF3_15795 [Acetobacteraceae bacterium]